MSDSVAAAGSDRLPWLADDNAAPRVQRAPRRKGEIAGWTIAAVLVVGGLSYWAGSRSSAPSSTVATTAPQGASATVRLPALRPVPVPEVRPAPQREVPLPVQREVRPSPVPQVRIAPPPVRKIYIERRIVRYVPVRVPAHRPVTHPASRRPAATHATTLTPWPPRLVAGASGRIVQIGAYGSPYQAKRGWWSMVRAYPAMQHLPAVVVDTRNSHGRAFYRFQVGTTSQAHSEVLCQRMQRIALSCAVVGLPWKAKVER